MEKKILKIGETYITGSGDIRKLVRIENGRAYFENLSKDVDDDWGYEKDGTYSLSVTYQETYLKEGYLKVYEG